MVSRRPYIWRLQKRQAYFVATAGRRSSRIILLELKESGSFVWFQGWKDRVEQVKRCPSLKFFQWAPPGGLWIPGQKIRSGTLSRSGCCLVSSCFCKRWNASWRWALCLPLPPKRAKAANVKIKACISGVCGELSEAGEINRARERHVKALADGDSARAGS